jgi:hypothetical protein
MYGTYWGFSLPLNTSAALVANRPSVLPLASTTNHLRAISLPLGIKVLISLLPSKTPVLNKTARYRHLANYEPQQGGETLEKTQRKALLPAPNERTGQISTLPNKSVRVRTTGAGPQRALARPGSHLAKLESSSRQPVPADPREIRPGRPVGTVRIYTQGPQAQHRARTSEYPNQASESTKSHSCGHIVRSGAR